MGALAQSKFGAAVLLVAACGELWLTDINYCSSQIGWTQIPLQPFLTPHKEQEKFPVTSDGKINGDIEIEIESTQTEGDVFVPKVKTGAVTSALKGALKRAGSMGVGLTAPADGSDTEEESEDEDEIEDYGYVFVEATKGERGLFGCGSAWKLRYLHLYNAENVSLWETVTNATCLTRLLVAASSLRVQG